MPAHVRRIASRVAQTPEPSQVYVADPRRPQLCRQGLSVKLRVVPRPRDTAHVDDALDPVRPKKIEKGFTCARRMPNRQNSEHCGFDLSHHKYLFRSNP